MQTDNLTNIFQNLAANFKQLDSFVEVIKGQLSDKDKKAFSEALNDGKFKEKQAELQNNFKEIIAKINDIKNI